MTDIEAKPMTDALIARLESADGPKGNALKTIEKMLEDREGQLKSCERMLELLKPEWDKFKARTGHDVYVTRDYADHFSAARTHRKEIEALALAAAALKARGV